MFKPDSDPEAVARYCEDQFTRAYEARRPVERQWLLNLAFFYGRQWAVWGPKVGDSRRLREPPAPSWRVRLTVNKIQPYVRRETARMSSQKPRGFVMPRSSEQSDRSAARMAEDVAEYLHEELRLDEVMDDSDWWTANCGHSFLKVRFTEEMDPATKMPGRLRVDSIRPFDIFLADMEETRLHEQQWVSHVRSMPITEIRDTWNVDVTADSASSEVDEKVRNVMSVFSSTKNESHAVVKEFWFKPTKDFPNGLVATVCNNILLPFALPPIPEQPEIDPQTGQPLPMPEPPMIPEGTMEWPFEHGRLPFISRGHTRSGRAYDASFIEQVIPVQREYNRSRSQIVENKNLTARPQWTVAIGSVDAAQLNSRPGSVIEHTPGFDPPQPLTPPPLPNYVMQHIEVTGQEMDEIASQNEVSKGSVPPGVEAATAIAYLQEKDDSAIAYTIRSKERAFQEVNRQLLSLVVQYWDVGRMVSVGGKNRVVDAYSLKGSDLRGNVDYRVVTGSGTPVSRAAQHAEIMEMAKTGLLPAGKALRFVGMPDVEAVIDEIDRPFVQAMKENLMNAKGQLAPVEVWHDHVVHLGEHDSFKMTEEYGMLDEQIKAIIRFHDYQHLLQLSMLFNLPVPPPNPQMEQQKMMAQSSGNPMMAQQAALMVDPVAEFELRKNYLMLQAGGGAPPPAQPTEGQPPQ